MARISNNPLVQGARGNFGKQYVYKKRGKDTHIARMPVVNKNAEVTEKQEKVRDLFYEASQYAKGAMSSVDLKKEYKKRASDGNTAFNIAFRDYLKAPVVKSINKAKYDGTIGSTIIVKAKDDFRVATVTVSIRDAAGVLVEEGSAQLNPIDRNKWIYTATISNPTLSGCTISAVAHDLPGNTGQLEILL